MRRYEVWRQDMPRRIHGDWHEANLVLIGHVDAKDGAEAIALAKRKRLARWPVVCEHKRSVWQQ